MVIERVHWRCFEHVDVHVCGGGGGYGSRRKTKGGAKEEQLPVVFDNY